MVSVTRPVVRKTAAGVYSAGLRHVVIDLQPPGTLIGFRLTGTRQTYHLSVEFCFREAMRQELDRRRRERLARKKAGGR
jgi:hypothetical protein